MIFVFLFSALDHLIQLLEERNAASYFTTLKTEHQLVPSNLSLNLTSLASVPEVSHLFNPLVIVAHPPLWYSENKSSQNFIEDSSLSQVKSLEV